MYAEPDNALSRTALPPVDGWPGGIGEVTIQTVSPALDKNVALAVFADGEHVGYVLTRPEWGVVKWRAMPGIDDLRPADWAVDGEFIERTRAAAIAAMVDSARARA